MDTLEHILKRLGTDLMTFDDDCIMETQLIEGVVLGVGLAMGSSLAIVIERNKTFAGVRSASSTLKPAPAYL